MTEDLAVAAETLFTGGGEMGALMRSRDWSQTPLGAVEHWSQSLKTAIRIMLTSRQPMFVWWGDELINLYNDAYRAILGGKHPEALGQPACQVWHEIWDQVGPRAESAMIKNEGTYDEALLLIMERNGYPEETYYTFSYSPVPDDQGHTGGIICANTDDTQRIVSERQLTLLRELAARAADARTFDEACHLSTNCLETNPYDLPFAIIYLIDPEHQCAVLAGTSGIDSGHAAAPKTIALNDNSIWPFTTVLELHQIGLTSDLASQFQTLPTGAWQQSPRQAVAVPIAPSGQTGKAGILVVGLNPFRLFDSNYQRFLDLVSAQIAASIANAHAYEEERKRAETLAELDQAKTVFFSNVSHEFRTPLTLILGPLEDVLNSATGISPRNREQLEIVHHNSLRLLKLVNILLDFSRIEAGRVQAVYEPTDLATLTQDLAGMFRSAIERTGMNLRVDCPPLPEPVYVDREMWEKIVLNLLSNAFKFTFKGEIAVVLSFCKDHIELKVQDTGTGIPTEELPYIFERFHRVQGARGRTYEGSGIGLSLVQELVHLHGGTIQVKSVVNEGTSFIVCLPTGSGHLPSERINATCTLTSTATGAASYVEEALRWLPEQAFELPILEPELESSAPGLQTSQVEQQSDNPDLVLKILLADDNADMRAYMKRLLSQRYDVKAVRDGEAALAVIQQQLPDLVITDVMMPKLDGFELLRVLRTDPRTQEIPIILLSARAGEESKIEGLTAGADDYLVKPFSARELLVRVEATLKLAQMRREVARYEQALRLEAEAAQEKISTILESITDAFVAFDHQWRYTYVNEQAANLLHKTRDELLGKQVWREVFPNRVGTMEYKELHRALTEQVAVVFEDFIPTLNIWFEAHAYPSREGLAVYFQNISDRKRVEQKREHLLVREQAARAESERANRIKDEFLAIVSHELRSPLNPILGWSTLLQTRTLDSVETAKALSTIQRNAKLQAELIEDLLDLSRILRGKLSLNVCPTNLILTIQAAMETMQLAADARSIQIETILDPDIGLVLGDSSRLQQVVWNLLSNAIKFTPEGGKVSIGLECVGSQAQITVSDTGKGISPDFLPQVFDYFCQENSTTKRKFGGLGLGLAIVHHLVELHGGTIEVESPGEGQGATFTVKLPLISPTPQINPGRELSELASDLTGIQVLIVDDATDTREFVGFLIEQYGATVIAVASAHEALAVLTHAKPDVLLSDIGMPEMDGYMLMQQIRTLPPEQGGQIPAIALTAYAGEIDYQQAMLVGFQQHISKPVEPLKLIEAITSLVNSAGSASL